MSTLAEVQESQFREEVHRLLRALFDSIEREGSLIREMRLMKESLVEVALRLQVSYQINEMDEVTMVELRKEVTDARMSALSANKQFQEAAELILVLKREIGSLKRQMKDVRNVDAPIPHAAPQLASVPSSFGNSPTKHGDGASDKRSGHGIFGNESDAEVDALMQRPLYSSSAEKTPHGPQIRSKQTPFQEWKMQQYVYAPDTMEGSRNHDPMVVALLNAAASSGSSLYDRSTKSIIAKSAMADTPEAKQAQELAAALHGLTLPGLEHKKRREKEKGTSNIWGLTPPHTLLSPKPIRLTSPVAGKKVTI